MKIRNKITGEVKEVGAAQLPAYGISSPKITPTPTPPVTAAASTPQELPSNPIVELLDTLGLGLAPNTVGAGASMAKLALDKVTGNPNANQNYQQGFRQNQLMPKKIRESTVTGDVGGFAKTMGQEGLGAAAWLIPLLKFGTAGRLAASAGTGGGQTALDKNTSPDKIAISGLLSGILPEAARGALHLGDKGVGNIVNSAVEKKATASPTKFALQDIFNPVKETIPTILPPGRQREGTRILNSMQAEAAPATRNPKQLLSSEELNTLRKLFNKSFGKEGTRPAVEKNVSKQIRGMQVKDQRSLDTLLTLQKFLTYDIPQIIDSLPLGRGIRGAGNIGGILVNRATPSPNGVVGELLQSLLRGGTPGTINALTAE